MADETSTKEQFIQFYGPVDIPNYQYREFRVRETNLANKSKIECTSKTITDGLRHITEKHNQKISDLKKQIREIEKINSSWNSLENVSEEDVKNLLSRVLQSEEKSIKQFEIDNFCADHDWMSTKKAKDGITLKALLSSINKVDEDGNQLGKRDDEEDNRNDQTCKEDTSPAHSDSDDSVIETMVVDVELEKKSNGLHVKHLEVEKSSRVDNRDIVEFSENTPEKQLISTQLNGGNQVPVEKLDQESQKEEETVDTTSPSEEDSGKDSETENDETENETESEIEDKMENGKSHKERPENSKMEKREDFFKPFFINLPDDKDGYSVLDKTSIENFPTISQKNNETNGRSVLDTVAETAEDKEKEKQKKSVISVQIAELTKILAIQQNHVAFDIDKIRELNVINSAAKRKLETVHENEENSDEPVLKDTENGNKRNDTDTTSNGKNVAQPEDTENEKDEKSDEEGDEDDECYEAAQSEESFETTNTSTTADSDPHDRCQSPKPVVANKNRVTAPHANRKKRSKKGKKAKKPKNGPKMTVEEIEAIKRKKKEEKDREFERKDAERRGHMEKVDTSDRHKTFRKCVQTALQLIKTDSSKLPIPIKQLDNDIDLYISSSTDMERTSAREKFFETRVVECTTMYVGAELLAKMELLSLHQDLIYKSVRLFQYFMYLGSLDETSEEFCEFEVATLKFFFAGYEQNTVPTSESTGLESNFYSFVCNVLPGIPETDQFVNTVRFVRNKLLVFSDMAATINVTYDEKILREGYMAIGELLKQYQISTDLSAFLYTYKENPSYALMEAWFLESRKPVPFEYDV